MSNDFINRRRLDDRKRSGQPSAPTEKELILLPSFDTFIFYAPSPNPGNDRWNTVTGIGSTPNTAQQIPVGLMNIWDDRNDQPTGPGGGPSIFPAVRTPTRAVLAYNLSGISAGSNILSASLNLTVANSRDWFTDVSANAATTRNLASSGGGKSGNNQIVTPTNPDSLYPRYISPFRFWASRDVTPPAKDAYSNVNVSYQCLEPKDIEAERARNATGVQIYRLNLENFVEKYFRENWFGEPFFPGYGLEDPILRWISPTGSGGTDVENIITNPVYIPPSYPPGKPDPLPPSPSPPTPWWDNTDRFPEDRFGPDYTPEREFSPIDGTVIENDTMVVCGTYFIDPTTGEYWFKSCEGNYFTWNPEGFWLPWTDIYDVDMALKLRNPECLYKEMDEAADIIRRGPTVWVYDWIRWLRLMKELGFIPPDFPIPTLEVLDSGEGVIVTYPEYEYLIEPKVR